MNLDGLRKYARQFWVGRAYGERSAGGLISSVFPAEFNMSAGHQYVLPVLAAEKPLASPETFFVVERCLRRLDLGIVGYSPFHLSLVEMAVAARLEAATGTPSLAPLAGDMLEFLEGVGLHRKTLVITCCGGGRLGACYVDADNDGRAAWAGVGVPPSRILLVSGRRNVIYSAGEPHPIFGRGARPAGLAYEIFWPIGPTDEDGFVEIASVNVYTCLQRARSVVPTANRAIGVGFGLERLAAACIGLKRVFDLDSLKPLVAVIHGMACGSPGPSMTLWRAEYERLADRMRSIAFVIADGQGLDQSARGRILSDILAGTLRITESLGIGFGCALECCLDVLESCYGGVYPQLKANRSCIVDICTAWLRAKRPPQ